MPTQLRNRPQRGTHGSGLAQLLFGLPFIGVGVFISLVARGVIGGASRDAPAWLLYTIGVMFGGAGLLVSIRGALDARRTSRRRRLRLQFPREPWRGDALWDTSGERTQPFRQVLGQLVGMTFVSLFMAPIYWMAKQGMSGVVYVVGGVLGLIVVAGFLHVAYLMLRALTHGSSAIRFDRFPYHPGGELTLTFLPGRGLRRFQRLHFALRCIHERREVRQTRKGQSVHLVHAEQYLDEYTLVGGQDLPADATEVPVVFSLPSRIPTTSLSAEPIYYWELEVKAEARGVDDRALFLLPVYADPAKAADPWQQPAVPEETVTQEVAATGP